MSYQEKNINVYIISFGLLLGFFVIKVVQMIQAGGLNSTAVFSLWGTIIVLAIIVNIIASVVVNVVFSILHTMKTNEEVQFIADERDQMIELKGSKVAYNFFSIGVFFAMLTFVFGQPAMVMFTILVFSALFAIIIGNVYQLYLYRRGF